MSNGDIPEMEGCNTSLFAWRRAQAYAKRKELTAFRFILESGAEGVTRDEIDIEYEWGLATVTPVVKALIDQCMVYDTGRRRYTRRERPSEVLQANTNTDDWKSGPKLLSNPSALSRLEEDINLWIMPALTNPAIRRRMRSLLAYARNRKPYPEFMESLKVEQRRQLFPEVVEDTGI